MLKGYMVVPIIKVIKKIITKDEIKALLKRVDVSTKTQEEIEEIKKEKGFDIIYFILEKLPEAEKEIFEVIALHKQIKFEEAKALDLPELIEAIKEIVGDESIKQVFTLAMK